MSYDVAFWRYEDSLDHDHVAVHAALQNGSEVDGLAVLDIDAVVACLAELLSAWDRIEERTWEKPKSYLQIWTSPQHLSINMSYSAARPVLLKIATPMRRFGCGLWNPQLNLRLPGYDEAGAKDER
jgi:hypothetical protein